MSAQVNSDVSIGRRTLVALGRADRLGFLWNVVLPVWAQGVLLRRRRMLGVAARRDWDANAVRFMQSLRRRYGNGPLLIRFLGRSYALLLAAADVRRVLSESPRPFTPASSEKRAALAHFEPHNSLITRGPKRAARRRFNDAALESSRPIHRLAGHFVNVAREEAARLISGVAGGQLEWSAFSAAWYAGVRRIVLGNSARGDHLLTDQLYRLRANANWVFFRPIDRRLRERYRERLNEHLARAESGSLAEMVASIPLEEKDAPADQVTQWLFAFDAGGITVFRALALLAQDSRPADHGQDYLRAVFLDTQRLWPTTPVILRETTEEAAWGDRTLAKGSGVVIFAPFFQRDDERLANANRLAPRPWLDKDPALVPPFIPFSSGPAACPGRHLVTLIGSAWLAALLDLAQFELIEPQSLKREALPGTLDYFSICFRVTVASEERTQQAEARNQAGAILLSRR